MMSSAQIGAVGLCIPHLLMLEDPGDEVIFIAARNTGRNWSQFAVSDKMGNSSAPGSAFVFSCTIFLLKYINNGISVFQILEFL